MADRKVVSLKDFAKGMNGPQRLGGDLFQVIELNAEVIGLTPVVVLSEDDGTPGNGYYLDELVAFVSDPKRRTDFQVGPYIKTTTVLLLVRLILGLQSMELMRQVNKVGRWPMCLLCGTKMRPSGEHYVCEGCGSVHTPATLPGVGAA